MINRAMLYSKFVRYNEMDSAFILNPSTKEIVGQPLDIYLDVQSVYKDVLSTEFISDDMKTLIINVLNMCAHYRHFFRKRLGTDVRVFIVNSSYNLSGNICEQYNSNRDIFSSMVNLIKYFSNIYYIYRENINASAIIYSLIKTESVNKAKFVLSRDIYAYQLAPLFDKCIVFRPGYRYSFVTANNAIDCQFKNTTSSSDLSPLLIPVIMAYNKCTELGLPLVKSYKTALNGVRDMIKRGLIIQGYNTPTMLLDDAVRISGFGARWSICDLVTHGINYMYSPLVLDETWKVKRACDLRELASALDEKFNSDPDNILNYIYLLE